MPMIRSNKLVVAASLSLVLCLTLAGCIDDFMWPDDLPEDVTVRTSEWLGEYDGAATVLVYRTGSVYSDVSGYMSMAPRSAFPLACLRGRMTWQRLAISPVVPLARRVSDGI
jgi:hypothetical protein